MQQVKWFSAHNHSHYSLLDGLSKPLDLISRAVDINLYGLNLSDHGNCSGVIQLLKSREQYINKIKDQILKTSNSEKIDILNIKIERAKTLKLSIGNEFYLINPNDEKQTDHLVVIARNKNGFKNLIKATSESTKRDNFYRRPRLSLQQLSNYSEDLIVISGHPGSSIYNICYDNLSKSFEAKTYEEAKQYIHRDWKKRVLNLADEYKQIFKDRFYLETQLIDKDRLPGAIVVTNILRWVSKQLNIPCVASCDSHYCTKEQSMDQRILLCSLLHTTLPKVKRALQNQEEIGFSGFFKSDQYYLPSPEEIQNLHTPEELQTSIDIADSCESYTLDSKPIIPAFTLPDNFSSPDEYIRSLCRDGWREKIYPQNFNKDKQAVYGERIKYELGVLTEAGLSNYFLLVKDIIDYVKSQGGLVGPGRGSAAGCLTSYFLGCTSVDPIKYNLLFERFYNAGRNTKDRISLADFDIDIQASYVDKVINYVKEKYGKTKVGKIATYGRLMGRACLKEVLRVHESMSFDEMNRCTKFIPDFAAVAGEIEDMKEDMEDGEPSLILWSLQNNKKELSEWCSLDENGKCVGPFAEQFSQAMRLEGTYKNISEHAAGIVIFPEDIDTIAPVIYDKQDDCKISLDMHDIETLGGVKMDILSLKALDCISDSQYDVCNNFLNDI